ncbi:MAG: D-alanyl-D-alanine carboxypeptidase family protein [Thermodesulfobacteriota bacterium]
MKIFKRNSSAPARAGLALLLLLLLATPAQAFKVNTKAAILADAGTGKVLYQKNEERLIPPASLTKVMTMYLVYEAVAKGEVSLKDTIAVGPEVRKAWGSRMHLKEGDRVTLEQLMKGMAVASGNDACLVTARHLAGSIPAFVARMNKKAKELGMTKTTFKNPNGLPARGQVSTAEDLLTLSQAYLKRFPQSLDFHSMQTFTYNKVRHKNCNRLLGNMPGVDGLKTGYVAASGFNIVSTVKRGDKRLIAVVLGATTASQRAKETRKLLERGLSLVGAKHVASAPDNDQELDEPDSDELLVQNALSEVRATVRAKSAKTKKKPEQGG